MVAQDLKESPTSNPNLRVHNIGSGTTTSVNELADMITELMQKLYDRQVEVKHVKPPTWRKEAKEEFDYSIGKISAELDYEPQSSLKMGIKEILRRIS